MLFGAPRGPKLPSLPAATPKSHVGNPTSKTSIFVAGRRSCAGWAACSAASLPPQDLDVIESPTGSKVGLLLFVVLFVLNLTP